jgi:hypothetical protein
LHNGASGYTPELRVSASNSVSSDISRIFTDAPTDKKAIGMLVGGVVMTIIGLVGLPRGSRN